jgi:transposase-like protein
MVELHRAGRGIDELAKEFGCTSWSIRQWVKQADRDGGRGDEGDGRGRCAVDEPGGVYGDAGQR